MARGEREAQARKVPLAAIPALVLYSLLSAVAMVEMVSTQQEAQLVAMVALVAVAAATIQIVWCIPAGPEPQVRVMEAAQASIAQAKMLVAAAGVALAALVKTSRELRLLRTLRERAMAALDWLRLSLALQYITLAAAAVALIMMPVTRALLALEVLVVAGMVLEQVQAQMAQQIRAAAVAAVVA